MKKLGMLLMLLFALAMGSHRVYAQSVTITLMPGWNWISIPLMDTLDFETAMGSVTPAVGDIIKSRWGAATYTSDGQWRGTISEFYPGYGYHYKSNRTMPVTVIFTAQHPDSQVIVTTTEPTDITANSATCGGNVASSNGDYVSVTLRGICWSTNPNPTFNDNYVELGNGLGSFTTSMTDMSIGTTYYVRAFAVTENGTFYGEQKTFSTRDGVPTLATVSITDITRTNATSGGIITDDGGLPIIIRGVCWSTSPNPTIDDTHSVDGNGMGAFSSSITGLSPGTTYYIRAYATNDNITAYGNEISFVTLTTPIGAINGLFSVSATRQVYFSRGNLQYQASTNTWRFANNQYDRIGNGNSNISSSYNGWIDLFGWGTSGYDHGANCYQPWSTSQNNSDYYAYGSSSYNLRDQSGQADWGYNPISNGGNVINVWRSLTYAEWYYLLNTRNTVSGIRYAKAMVGGINGVILLPDNWNTDIYTLFNTNQGGSNVGSNMISISQWNTLQNAGAVFLPAAGDRVGNSLIFVNDSRGYYWSASSYYDGNRARYLVFYESVVEMYYDNRYAGLSVRLVCNAE